MKLGRRKALDAEALVKSGEMSATQVAAHVGVSRAALYRAVSTAQRGTLFRG